MLNVKLVTLTKKIAKQLQIKHSVSDIELTLFRNGWKAAGIITLDERPFLLMVHKSDPKAVLLSSQLFYSPAILELTHGKPPMQMERIILV